MPTFIMHTKFSSNELRSPQSLKELEGQFNVSIRSEFPTVEWINVEVLGPCEYLDTFQAPNMDTAIKVATLIRTFGYAHTEVWPAA